MMLSPDVVLENIPLPTGEVAVVRDDLLAGGTKQRAIVPFLRECVADAKREFVYASPFSGFAQVALAVSCQALGLRCVLLCESDPAEPGKAHEFTSLARRHGAVVHLTATLGEAENSAEIYAGHSRERLKIPLGFACTPYRRHLGAAIAAQWKVIETTLGRTPTRVWLPLGSGTLATVFRAVVPDDTALVCVDVHVLEDCDSRIREVCKLRATTYLSAPERFADPVRVSPGIPSNTYYDAKLWQFLLEQSRPGDLWWNVAR